jgi:UrcA family protein
MTIKHALAAAFVASAAFAAATPAAAEDFAFRYKSHELATAGGRADLMKRLDRRISSFCEDDGWRGVYTRKAAAACKDDVKAEIMAKIDHVAFAALD